MPRLYLYVLSLFLAQNTFAQLYRLEYINANTAADDFSVFELDGEVWFCSDRRVDPLVYKSDLQGEEPVKWFALDGSPDNIELPAGIRGWQHVGPAVWDSQRNELIFTGVQSPKRQDTTFNALYAMRRGEDGWEVPVALFDDHNWNDAHPTLSADGRYLIFASDRPGGHGRSDLYVCARLGEGWSAPSNLGRTINSVSAEYFPAIDHRGWLHFASDREGGKGGMDLWLSYPEEEGWSSPQPVPTVNTRHDEFAMHFLSDGSGIMCSNRKGNDADLYRFEVVMPEFEQCRQSAPEPTCYLIEETEIVHADTLPVYYEWEYGDGTTARGLSNEHCFPGIGRYEVALNIYDTLTGARFARVSELMVEILPADIPFIASPDTVELYEEVMFKVDDRELHSLHMGDHYWASGDGRYARGAMGAFSYSAPGRYEVTLGVLSVPTDGIFEKRCVTKEIVVVDPKNPELVMSEADASPKHPALLRGKKKHKGDELYFVEFHRSNWQLALNDPFFEHVPYEITERYTAEDSLFHYSVGESESLSELMTTQREMKAAGYDDALIQETGGADFEASVEKRGRYYTDEEKVEMNRYVDKLADIRFDVNSSAIARESQANLDRIAELLQSDEALLLVIEAHTDDQGDEAYNLQLSEERAQSVVGYLTEAGVEHHRMQATGYGNTRPIADNTTDAGRSLNRRVGFRLVFTDESAKPKH